VRDDTRTDQTREEGEEGRREVTDAEWELTIARLTDKGLLPYNGSVLDVAALESLTEQEREVMTEIVQHEIVNAHSYLAMLEYDKRQQWPTEI
jgi:hypothetical protein